MKLIYLGSHLLLRLQKNSMEGLFASLYFHLQFAPFLSLTIFLKILMCIMVSRVKVMFHLHGSIWIIEIEIEFCEAVNDICLFFQGQDVAFEPAKLLWLIQRDFLRKLLLASSFLTISMV